jgi:hypothetical protein
MAQLSRPYQVILLFVAVLALAWFTVLHNRISTGSGGSSGGGSSSASTPKAGSIQHKQSTPTSVYHGPVPGVQGLSKDIRKAHEAVGTSEAQTHKLESATGSTSPTAPASTASQTSTAPSQASGTGVGAAKSKSSVASHSTSTSHRHRGTSRPSHSTANAGHSRALVVAKQLQQGKIVLLLFWNPRSFNDQEVHSQVQAASRSLKGKVATDFAKAREVGDFGAVTRNVNVLQTPTLLLINRKGLATTITGLTDAFSIEQAVREAGG